jgi:hypothetical protein
MWTQATKRKAPHKPILLLAVLDLVARGVITSPFIDVTGDIVELNELFNLYWRRIIPLEKTSSICRGSGLFPSQDQVYSPLFSVIDFKLHPAIVSIV